MKYVHVRQEAQDRAMLAVGALLRRGNERHGRALAGDGREDDPQNRQHTKCPANRKRTHVDGTQKPLKHFLVETFVRFSSGANTRSRETRVLPGRPRGPGYGKYR